MGQSEKNGVKFKRLEDGSVHMLAMKDELIDAEVTYSPTEWVNLVAEVSEAGPHGTTENHLMKIHNPNPVAKPEEVKPGHRTFANPDLLAMQEEEEAD